MPIERASSAWRDCEEACSVKEELREFLRTNSSNAYHPRELADEVVGTEWEKQHERERKMQELGEEEYLSREHEGEFPELEMTIGDEIANQDLRDAVWAVLTEIVDDGDAVLKRLPVDYHPSPEGDSRPLFYAWNRDGDE